MSFNFNKLVQPECGGPNPLVAAAQQITTAPPARPIAPRLSLRQQPTNRFIGESFTKEFIQQNPLVTSSTFRRQANQGGITSLRPTTSYRPSSASSQAYMMHSISSQVAANQQIIQPTTTSAGDQLEAKYRNDMILNQSSSQRGDGKLDDVDFWQSLSQQYIGPTTYDNITRLMAKASVKTGTSDQQAEATQEAEVLTSENTEQTTTSDLNEEEKAATSDLGRHLVPPDMEYTFDERNPLKDQFEDPFAEGLKRLEQGDIPSAALLFEAAVQNDPGNAEAWRYLGTTQAQNEKDMSAIKALRNCLNINKRDQEARLAIAVSLANEMYHHETCKHLLEWLMNHDVYQQVGATLNEFEQLDSELSDDPFYMNAVDQKHYKYVRDKFVEAARMSPNNPDPEVQSSLGVLFNMRGEYEKAVDCFKAALSVKSNDSLLWNRLGATLANGNKSDEAVIAYRKALEISPGFLRSRYNLAISLIHLNTYDEAAKQLVQILNMQAAGRGSKNAQIRTRSITSTAIWNTLRTVVTLLNKPELYPIIDGRDLARCNEEIFKTGAASN